MSFKNYLNSLNRFQIFQLYTIIAIAILFLYFYLIDINKDTKIYNNENIKRVNKNIKELKEKLVLENNIKILKELEIEAQKYKSLNIQNFSLNKNSINLSGVSNKNDFFEFLIYCENYSVTSRLNSMSLKPAKQNKLFNFSLTIKFKEKYLSQLSTEDKEKIKKKIDSLSTKKKKKEIHLQAIFNDQVIINDKLLSIGDKLKKYTIAKIYKNHILLKKDKEIKKLYIQGDKNGK